MSAAVHPEASEPAPQTAPSALDPAAPPGEAAAFVEARQRLISYLVKLNRALRDDLPDLSQALLPRFCEALVDYLSLGHFRVYQRLPLSSGGYALLEASTRAGVAFNDRFGARRSMRVDAVRPALERLARALGARFELEDELFEGLLH